MHPLHGYIEKFLFDVVKYYIIAVQGADKPDLLSHGPRSDDQNSFDVRQFHKRTPLSCTFLFDDAYP
jgi:hypothetical protein